MIRHCSLDRNSFHNRLRLQASIYGQSSPLLYLNLPSLHRRENLACYHFWRSFFGPNPHFRRFGLFQNSRTNSAAYSSMLWCLVWELLSQHDLQFCSGLRIRRSRSKGWEWSHSCWKVKHSKYNVLNDCKFNAVLLKRACNHTFWLDWFGTASNHLSPQKNS